MRKANKSTSLYTLIVGENEIKSGNYQLKNMQDGKQSSITATSCVEEIKNLINQQNWIDWEQSFFLLNYKV